MTKKKDEIEQTRIRIKELGKEQKWLDWVEKYADQVGELGDYTDAQRKEYLEGIVDSIKVSLDQHTKDHHLGVVFRLPLVDDGIEYIDEKNKNLGYEVIDGEKIQTTIIQDAVVKSMSAAARKVGRQKQNAKKKSLKQLTTKPQTNTTVE